MTEATTKPCPNCGITGKAWVDGKLVTCVLCNGTGVQATFKLIGTLPAVAVEMSVNDLEATIAALRIERDDLLARVGAQQSEIERLKADVELREQVCGETQCDLEGERHQLASLRGDIEELTIQRDTAIAARDEVERERNGLLLRVSEGAADDRIAALEAERGEEKRIRHLVAQERNDATYALCGLEHRHKLLGEELTKANARAEAYLAVVRAKDAEIAAITANWQASMRVGVAMMEAGIRFRHVSTETAVEIVQENQCEKSDERS